MFLVVHEQQRALEQEPLVLVRPGPLLGRNVATDDHEPRQSERPRLAHLADSREYVRHALVRRVTVGVRDTTEGQRAPAGELAVLLGAVLFVAEWTRDVRHRRVIEDAALDLFGHAAFEDLGVAPRRTESAGPGGRSCPRVIAMRSQRCWHAATSGYARSSGFISIS